MMIVSGVENESSVILSNALEEKKTLRGNFISWMISDLGDEATKII